MALGERAVERAVRARLVATGQAPAAWADRLRRDRDERAALIDAVVVPETMLFRDGAPFEALMAMAMARTTAPGPMRVLSAACSTGEEPYSAAIALLAGGLPAESVHVLGLDVSAAVLAVAASGVLPRTALRGVVPAWSDPYLERRADGTVAIAPVARGRVTFALANLLTAPPAGTFDAILCRNLLIYLTPPARARVTDWLRSQLAPDAPLFVGHAEVGVLLDAGWRRSHGHGPYALEPAPAPPASAATPPAPPPLTPPVPRREAASPAVLPPVVTASGRLAAATASRRSQRPGRTPSPPSASCCATSPTTWRRTPCWGCSTPRPAARTPPARPSATRCISTPSTPRAAPSWPSLTPPRPRPARAHERRVLARDRGVG